MLETANDKSKVSFAGADSILDAVPDLPKEVVDMSKIYLFDVHGALGDALDELFHAGGVAEVAGGVLAMQADLYILIFPFVLLLQLLRGHEPDRDEELLVVPVGETIHRDVFGYEHADVVLLECCQLHHPSFYVVV
jgi:hypothetical protein